ncbi:glyoxalase [Polaribacter vadi]|uniref:Glyoxalase n=1 Tax=Polaribacter vadi TaxID=1774273 RepID=A0A1B8TXU2_9FLAO|nr:glyoxalase [Polaribacter vadi]AOW16554.1 glyoxalase [Polaribacter vadi]OBY64541.1 glyoxalase [Polaribacter vadi]
MHKSIRTFIGAKNFKESSSFYKDLGFSELIVSENMSFFNVDEKLGFYLQKAFVKDWVDNSMLFLEVEDIESYLSEIKNKNLTQKYKKVRLSEIVDNDWGREFFLHDPSGILWHIGCFY